MQIQGRISKMVTVLTNPITYHLPFDEEKLCLNDYLGQKIRLSFTQKIRCIACLRQIKKSYQDGYCFQCMQTLASCDLCIVRPERCHFHLGTCREPSWGQQHCMIPHWVYLANASGIKVGITRQTQVPTRWIDQGAAQAMGLFQVATRRLSGLLEIEIGKFISDKTDWRKMLKSKAPELDLLKIRQEVISKIKENLVLLKQEFGDNAIQEMPEVLQELHYPVLQYPTKITSLSFDKAPFIEGVLQGIKGQYLLLDCGVLNIRRHTGYEVAFEA